MRCNFCGNEAPEGAKECPICGASMGDSQGDTKWREPEVREETGYPYDTRESSPFQYGAQNEDAYQYGSSNGQPYQYRQQDGINYGQGYIQSGQQISSTPYLIFSILVTLLCCLPFGIAAIVYAAKINTLQNAGDYEGAKSAAKKSKIFTIIGAVSSLILIIVCIIFGCVGVMQYETGDYNTSTIVEQVKNQVEDEEENSEMKKAEAVTLSGELGTTWDSYTVQINDTVLTLPCAAADLEAVGLYMDTDDTPESYVINPDEYAFTYFLDQNGNEICVDFVNLGEEAKTIKECIVGGISVDDYLFEDETLTVIFPGGIKIGSTKDEVLAAFGKPDDEYENEGYSSYSWYSEESYYNCFDLTFSDDVVTGINMQHYE